MTNGKVERQETCQGVYEDWLDGTPLTHDSWVEIQWPDKTIGIYQVKIDTREIITHHSARRKKLHVDNLAYVIEKVRGCHDRVYLRFKTNIVIKRAPLGFS